jgi:hypothetical protein
MRLETLKKLNMGRYIASYFNDLPLNIVSSEFFTRHALPALLATHFVDDHMEKAHAGVQTSMNLVVTFRETLTVTCMYATTMVF